MLKTLKNDPEIRHIPVIALSSDAMPIDIETGIQAGFAAYLTKPEKTRGLFSTIGKTLDKEHASKAETSSKRPY